MVSIPARLSGLTTLILLAAAACSDGRDSPAGAATIVDSAGVTIVTAPGELLDRPLDVVLASEPHLRIGSVAGGEETQFTRLAAAHRLSDGRLMVAERGAQRVRLFSPDGEFVNWIGRVGQGPGEFSYVVDAGVLDGDTVWVFDIRGRALELFTPDGSFVRSIRPGRQSDLQVPRRSWMLTNGTVVEEASTLGAISDMNPGEFVEDVVLTVFDREGKRPREVVRAPGIHYTVNAAGDDGTRRTATAIFDERFRPLPAYGAAGERVVFGDPGTFEIRGLSLDGTVRSVVRVDRPRRPLTQSMIDAYERTFLELAEADGRPGQLEGMRQAIEMYTYADSLPHFLLASVEASGDAWLMEYGIAGEPPGPSRLWQVDLEAGPEGYLEIPGTLRILTFEEDELLGYETDDYDVPYLVAYRLVERS